MQLKWGRDGWRSDFAEGDTVRVHFAVRHSDRREMLAIPAIVKRAGERCVGVEFHQSRPMLPRLLEGYRVAPGGSDGSDGSLTHERDSGGAGNDPSEMPRPNSISLPGATGDDLSANQAGTRATDIISGGRVPDAAKARWGKGLLPVALVSLLVVLPVAVGVLLLNQRVHRELNEVRSTLVRLSDQLDASERRSARVAELESTLSHLIARTDGLQKAIVDLTIPSSAPADVGEESPETPSGGEKPIPAVPESAGARHVGGPDEATVLQSARAPEPEPPAEQPAPESAPAAPVGPSWHMVLISLRNERSADRLLAKAHSLHIPAEKYRTEPGAKGLWRLQVSGFASREAARTYAEQIKPKLGLNDVWIVRH